MALRLAAGEVTVLLGPARARRAVMTRLDDGSGRAAGGREAIRVLRVSAPASAGVERRMAALRAATGAGAAIVLVDRLTDGLTAAQRRTVLAGLAQVAVDGCAVLVDDADPIAALAVADGALRIDASGDPVPAGDLDADLDRRDPGYRAS